MRVSGTRRSAAVTETSSVLPPWLSVTAFSESSGTLTP
jgi:hypothetical protein